MASENQIHVTEVAVLDDPDPAFWAEAVRVSEQSDVQRAFRAHWTILPLERTAEE